MDEPPGKRETLALQYLRGFAAMAVAIYHVLLGVNHYGPNVSNPTPRFGAAGVDLFFVISGFIMFYICAEKQPTPRQFLSGRLMRVLPLYWLVTLAMFFMPYVSRTIEWSSTLAPGHLLTSVLCIGGVHWPGGEDEFPVYRAGWTINYEMFFYLVFASCLVLRPIWRSAVAASVVLMVLALIGIVGVAPAGIASFYTAPILLEFVFGIWLGIYIMGYPLEVGPTTCSHADFLTAWP